MYSNHSVAAVTNEMQNKEIHMNVNRITYFARFSIWNRDLPISVCLRRKLSSLEMSSPRGNIFDCRYSFERFDPVNQKLGALDQCWAEADLGTKAGNRTW